MISFDSDFRICSWIWDFDDGPGDIILILLELFGLELIITQDGLTSEVVAGTGLLSRY